MASQSLNLRDIYFIDAERHEHYHDSMEPSESCWVGGFVAAYSAAQARYVFWKANNRYGQCLDDYALAEAPWKHVVRLVEDVTHPVGIIDYTTNHDLETALWHLESARRTLGFRRAA